MDDDCTEMMARFSIRRDGRHYRYRGHRYERLADAIAYAHLVDHELYCEPAMPERTEVVEAPSLLQIELMATLSISFENGVYRFAGYRYEHLADAACYARHCQQNGGSPAEC